MIKKLINYLYFKFIYPTRLGFGIDNNLEAIVDLSPSHKHTKPYIKIVARGNKNKYGWNNFKSRKIENIKILNI